MIFAVENIRLKKFPVLNGIWSHDLRDAGEVALTTELWSYSW